MPRPKVKDKKIPKSLSVRQSDHERHLKAAEKMDLGLNDFLVLAANELAERTFKGLGKLDLADELVKQSDRIQQLEEAVSELVKSIRAKEGSLT